MCLDSFVDDVTNSMSLVTYASWTHVMSVHTCLEICVVHMCSFVEDVTNSMSLVTYAS